MCNLNVYVGTYGKYNEGSIFGKWMNISNYENKSDFYAACKELHKDEADPEFMFQDWEGFPDGLITECGISDDVFTFANVINTLDEKQEKAFLIWYECLLSTSERSMDEDEMKDRFEDEFVGEYFSEEEFAEYFVSEVYPEAENNWMLQYFDYERFARDLFLTDYYFESGYVFRRY